jgi:hypothetical protein
MKRYDEYVRGGVDVIHEKLWQNATLPDDYLNKLHEFMEDFYNRHNDVITDDIIALCSLEPN